MTDHGTQFYANKRDKGGAADSRFKNFLEENKIKHIKVNMKCFHYIGKGMKSRKSSMKLKNELDVMPLRGQKIETLQGLLFIFFISLILRAILLRRARDAELLDKNSIEEILMELAKLRAVNVGGKWRLTEISKKQRTIFKKFEIGTPAEANLVINKGGV